MSTRPFPPARPHGELVEVLPGIFHVQGTVAMPGPVPITFSRAMTVIREGDRLVLVSSMRLSDEGLAKLEALGRVTDVLRLAGYHGMDDPFYKDRYGAKVWAIRGQRYTRGFDTKAKETYFTADEAIDATTSLPLTGARMHIFASDPPEGLLILERHGGTLVSGDSLQNWENTDEYFNLPAKLMMKAMGFIKPVNVGPGWFKQAKPPARDLAAILDLDFENVLPVHGRPVLGGAKEAFRPAIERAVRSLG